MGQRNIHHLCGGNRMNQTEPKGTTNMKVGTKALNLGLVALVCLFFGNAFSRADTVYVSNSENNTIEKFDSSGQGSVFANSGLGGPYGLAFDNSGTLYGANSCIGKTAMIVATTNDAALGNTALGRPSLTADLIANP